MTYALAALGVVTLCVVAGYLLACIDFPEAPPPGPTTRTLTRPPLGSVLHPPDGNQRKLEAAPHPEVMVNRLWASKSLWRSR